MELDFEINYKFQEKKQKMLKINYKIIVPLVLLHS